MFGVVGRRVGRRGAPLQVLEDEAGPAVGVLHRVDEHERVALHEIGAGITAHREQVVGLEQRRVGRADLVAVHAVHEPHDHRQRGREPVGLGGGQAARISHAADVGLHLIQLRDAVGAAHDEQPQRPAFPRARVFDEARTLGRGLRERAEVDADLVGGGDFGAGRVADDLLQGGDLRVVLRAGPERLLGGLRERRRGHERGRQRENQSVSKVHGPLV